MKSILNCLLTAVSIISSAYAADQDIKTTLPSSPKTVEKQLEVMVVEPDVKEAEKLSNRKKNEIELYLTQFKIATYKLEGDDRAKALLVVKFLEQKAIKIDDKFKQFKNSFNTSNSTSQTVDFANSGYKHKKNEIDRANYSKKKYELYESLLTHTTQYQIVSTDENPLLLETAEEIRREATTKFLAKGNRSDSFIDNYMKDLAPKMTLTQKLDEKNLRLDKWLEIKKTKWFNLHVKDAKSDDMAFLTLVLNKKINVNS